MFTSSTDTDKIIPAFVKALAAMTDVTKTRRVSAGPMTYTYADLSSVLDAVRPHLHANGLALSQYPSDDGVTTVIFHESGQHLSFPPLNIKPPGANPQQVGSAISYARRYSILSILGLATEDDDGRRASAPPRAAAPTTPDPLAERIDSLVADMRGLSDAGKERLRAWAAGMDKSLSPKSLAADMEWLVEVESYVDEIMADADDDVSVADEPDDDDLPS